MGDPCVSAPSRSMPEPGRALAAFRLGAIVLAAGGSSRMGSAKQLAMFDGKTLIARSVDAALGSGADLVVVVLGSDAERIRTEIADHPVRVVINPAWASGMASSIREGLAALLEDQPGLDAVLVALCDQPALSPGIIGQLAELHRATGRIASARYGGRNGAPAVFGRVHFGELARLAGDQGARLLLNGGPDRVASIDLPALAADIDTPSDLRDWVARNS